MVLQHERVLAASAAARALGVRDGMRASSVRMLVPSAHLQVRDIAREQAALQACALALLQYTPQVALLGAAGLVLDIAASLRLFGGIRALCRLVKQSMQKLGFSVRLSCAPNPAAASLLARSTKPWRVLKEADLRRRLDDLPCTLLPEAHPWLDWLDGIACYRLAQLRHLPRPGLQRRCGVALLHALDYAYGSKILGLQWVTAPPSFSARMELFARIEQTDGLLHPAQALLQQLMGWLQIQHLAVKGIALVMEHERGREALAATRLEIVLAQASAQDQHLMRLLSERLNKLVLPNVVIALSLQALSVQPKAMLSEDLFPHSQASAENFQQLVELLSARLGAENVLQAVPRADYRPEMANAWQAWTSLPRKSSSAQSAAQATGAEWQHGRPLWLLPTPLALRVQAERPYYGGPLRLISAAERIEAAWFAGQFASRDYFVAQHAQGSYCWLFRQRPSSEASDLAWYLQGLFA